MADDDWNDETLQAVGALLKDGEERGIGLTFLPDEHGWAIGYFTGRTGGELVKGYELGDTAKAARRPLDDVADEIGRARSSGT